MVKAAENTLGMNQQCPEKEQCNKEHREAMKNRNLVYILWVKQPNRITKQKLGNLSSLTNYRQKTRKYCTWEIRLPILEKNLSPIIHTWHTNKWFLHHDNAPRHTLLCSNSSPRKPFLSSPNHRTLQISLRVTFGCSLLWKWASRGRVSQPWRTSNRIRQPNSGGFQKKPSTGASNNGRIDGASVCARKGPTLKVIR